MRMIVGMAFGLVVFGLSSGAWSQWGGNAPVALNQAKTTTMAPTMQVAGTVVSRADAYLSAEVEGRLLEVAEPGERVEVGDVIAKIDDQTLTLRAQELRAEIARVKAQLTFLEAELKRFERLAQTNLAAASQIEQTRADRDVSQSNLDVANSRLAQVNTQLERTEIKAPFPGLVVERVAQAGERVGVGARVVRLYNPRDLEVVARAPLSYYRYVQPGDVLAVLADDEVLDAPVRRAYSVGGENTHVFELRLDMEAALAVGQTVRVTIPTADLRQVLAVPRDALVLRGDGVAIFIVDEDNTARRIQVTTGIGEGDWIEVKGPIKAGDRVVIRGNERLRPGQEVTVQEG